MSPDEIEVGDKLSVKPGLVGRRVEVIITQKYRGNSECGYVFNTDPPVGSGNGITSGWLEPINA